MKRAPKNVRSIQGMESSTAQADVPTDTGPSESSDVFSLELTQDQRDIRDWVHGFAEGVVRPAAARVG